MQNLHSFRGRLKLGQNTKEAHVFRFLLPVLSRHIILKWEGSTLQ